MVVSVDWHGVCLRRPREIRGARCRSSYRSFVSGILASSDGGILAVWKLLHVVREIVLERRIASQSVGSRHMTKIIPLPMLIPGPRQSE